MSTNPLPIEFVCVDHINMWCKDLEETLTFYQKVFGTDGEIKDQGQRGEVKWIIIGIPDKFYFCLYELKNREYDPDAMHINHIGFYVQDFDETLQRIDALGIPVEYRGKPITWHNRNGSTRSLYITDPNGYKIEFAEKLGGGLDQGT